MPSYEILFKDKHNHCYSCLCSANNKIDAIRMANKCRPSRFRHKIKQIGKITECTLPSWIRYEDIFPTWYSVTETDYENNIKYSSVTMYGLPLEPFLTPDPMEI